MRRRTFLTVVAILGAAVVLTAALLISAPRLRLQLERPPSGIDPPRAAESSSTRIPTIAIGTPADASDGIADAQLQSEVQGTILSFYRNVRNCGQVSVKEIHLTKPLDAAGSWQETWRVDACGEVAVLLITFATTPDGDFHYDIAEHAP